MAIIFVAVDAGGVHKSSNFFAAHGITSDPTTDEGALRDDAGKEKILAKP
jgi:hypothetical protein